jgi:hypothetical protein
LLSGAGFISRWGTPFGITVVPGLPALTRLPNPPMFWKSIKANQARKTMEKEQCPVGDWDGSATDKARSKMFPSEVLAMREVFYATLSQVVEIGIFAAAAGALAVGMMHVK